MTSLNIKDNSLCAAGGKALAEALTGNQVLRSLDISRNWLDRKKGYNNLEYDGNGKDLSGTVAISNAIPTMGTLVKIDLSSNDIPNDQATDLRKMCDSKSIDLKL